MGTVLNFHAGVLFIITEIFPCLASQTDVNQIINASSTKKEMLNSSGY